MNDLNTGKLVTTEIACQRRVCSSDIKAACNKDNVFYYCTSPPSYKAENEDHLSRQNITFRKAKNTGFLYKIECRGLN